MKNASQILYIVGRVFNFIFIGFTIIGIIVFGCTAWNQEFLARFAQALSRNGASQASIGAAQNLLIGAFIGSIIQLVVQIIVLVISFFASKNLRENSGRVASHVMMVVIGIIGFDVFYLLGGIFGCVSASQDLQPEEE